MGNYSVEFGPCRSNGLVKIGVPRNFKALGHRPFGWGRGVANSW